MDAPPDGRTARGQALIVTQVLPGETAAKGPEPSGGMDVEIPPVKSQAKGPGAQGLMVTQILRGETAAKVPAAQGAVQQRTVGAGRGGLATAASRWRVSEDARGSSAVHAEDSVLDSVTTVARCSSAATVIASRIVSSVRTAPKANDVLMDLHWLAAVARPPRSAPKVRCWCAQHGRCLGGESPPVSRPRRTKGSATARRRRSVERKHGTKLRADEQEADTRRLEAGRAAQRPRSSLWPKRRGVDRTVAQRRTAFLPGEVSPHVRRDDAREGAARWQQRS